MPESEKLQKVIARAGVASRRHAELLIERRRVTVDGVVAHVGMRVDASSAVVAVDGSVIPVDPSFAYYLINKPVGVVSTVTDPEGRSTVVEIVPDEVRVFPVGRLDRDSGGLLLLTNDGQLTARLTHPKYQVPKTYHVVLAGRLSAALVRRFVDGIDLDDGLAVARSARIIDQQPGQTMVEVVMTEGRNREIRRMAEGIGHPVTSLFRTAIGPLRDQALRAGDWRALSTNEIRDLYAAVMGEPDD